MHPPSPIIPPQLSQALSPPRPGLRMLLEGHCTLRVLEPLPTRALHTSHSQLGSVTRKPTQRGGTPALFLLRCFFKPSQRSNTLNNLSSPSLHRDKIDHMATPMPPPQSDSHPATYRLVLLPLRPERRKRLSFHGRLIHLLDLQIPRCTGGPALLI